MDSFPWLTAIAVIPLIGAAVIAFLPAGRDLAARKIGLIFAVIPLLMVIAMALQFSANSPDEFQFVENVPWIPAFGVSYALGVDGIALVLIAMATVLVPLVMIAGWREGDESLGGGSPKGYVALILALESCLIFVFAATDVFLFYVFFEVMLIPMFYLIGRYGGPQRSYAAMKFLLYSLLGGLFMLAALIGLYVTSARELGEGTFDFTALTNLNMDSGTQKMLFLGFFFAFAVKAPLFPFHTWLPDAAAEAKPGTAVLMIGVMDKVGTFGMIRLCLPIFPAASAYYAPIIIVIAVIGIIYGRYWRSGRPISPGLHVAPRLHFGFIVLGIFAFTAVDGGSSLMVNHGFTTAGLFIAGLMSRRGSKYIADFGGVNKVAPILAGTFLVVGLSSLALPGLSSFVSEFLVLVGTFTRHPYAAVFATLGIILAAIYILWLYQRTMTGPVKAGCEDFTDLNGRESMSMAPVIAIIIALGFFPGAERDQSGGRSKMSQVEQTNPPPLVPAATTSQGGAR
jgi:NADH-quinone oxidoreductase subunit M